VIHRPRCAAIQSPRAFNYNCLYVGLQGNSILHTGWPFADDPMVHESPVGRLAISHKNEGTMSAIVLDIVESTNAISLPACLDLDQFGGKHLEATAEDLG
jgi:hypothetical protein